MVNKIIGSKWAVVGIVIVVLLAILFSSPNQPPKEDDPKVIIQMDMIPVDNSPGEFILEYSNGNRELLKKDGTRVPLRPHSR